VGMGGQVAFRVLVVGAAAGPGPDKGEGHDGGAMVLATRGGEEGEDLPGSART
jgi:hypothetical protein